MLGFALHAWCAEITVKKSGGDYSSIQAAIHAAHAGDTVTVYAGTYYERVEITKTNLTLWTHSNDLVFISGSNRHVSAKPHMIGIFGGVETLRIAGFNICSNVANDADGGSGIFMEGQGHHIEILNNRIWAMRGVAGMGITVFGTNVAAPISNIVIAGNKIFDCEPADSEALVVNGNVTHFWILSNDIHDVNNIGIDMIGGETDINPTYGARHGVCADNRVRRARSSYGGGYGAGIYVDGGRDIVIERNTVTECDMGIEIGAENAGWNATNVVVRSNLLVSNDKIGLVFGGYEEGVGRVANCRFYNNTLYKNANTSDWQGEVIVNWASNCVFRNNIIYLSERGDRYAVLDAANSGNRSNRFDYNLYYYDGPATNVRFDWKGTVYNGFTQYQAAVRPNETNSLYANPAFFNAAATNFHLLSGSVAIDRGDPSNPSDIGERDLDGQARCLNYRADLGAYEYLFLERLPTGSIAGAAAVTSTWTAVPGARYEVERTDDLVAPSWTNVGGIVTAAVETVSQPDETAGADRRFYRCRRLLL